MIIISILILPIILASPEQERELMRLACTHSGYAFVLDNMNILELQFVLQEKSMDVLSKSCFDSYFSHCIQNISPKDAWNVLLLLN